MHAALYSLCNSCCSCCVQRKVLSVVKPGDRLQQIMVGFCSFRGRGRKLCSPFGLIKDYKGGYQNTWGFREQKSGVK